MDMQDQFPKRPHDLDHKFSKKLLNSGLSLTDFKFTIQLVCNPPYPPLLQPYILKVLGLFFGWPITLIITIIFLAFTFAVINMWNSEYTIRNANKGQLLLTRGARMEVDWAVP